MLAEAAATRVSLLTLPPEILIVITFFLDTRSALAFIGTSTRTRGLYSDEQIKSLVFEKQCLILLELRPAQRYRAKEKHALEQCYAKVLTQVLREDTSDQEYEKAVLLVEKFFKCFLRQEMKTYVNKVFASLPASSNWQKIFDRLASINLHLCVTLITQAVADFNTANEPRMRMRMRMPREKITYPFTDCYPLLADKLQFDRTLPATRTASGLYARDNITLNNNLRAEQFFRQIRTSDHMHSTVLHFAVAHGYFDIVPALTKNHPHIINFVNEQGDTPLSMMCAQNRSNISTPQIQADYIATIHTLLKLKANPNLQNHSGNTALMYMSRQNNLAGVELLLQYGAQVNLANNMKETALLYANRADIVTRLLEHGAQVNQQSVYQTTSLMRVCSAGLYSRNFQHPVNIVQILVAHGASINLQSEQGLTALMYACQAGNTAIVTLLLAHHANLHLQDKRGLAALMYACRTKNAEIATLLLAHNANLNLQDNQGLTALMQACQKQNTDAIKLLLEQHANLELQDKQGLTALMYACQMKNTDAVRLLLTHNANLDTQDNQGLTALMHACQAENTDVVKLLLEHHVNIHLQDKQALTALMHTSQKGNIDTLRLLLRHGAEINGRGSEQLTALIYACCREGNAQSLIEALLSEGASPDLQDAQGWSALIYASQKGNIDTLRLLLTYKATIDQADQQGLTPLMHASQMGHTEAVRLLLEQGAKLEQEDSQGMTALTHACQKGRVDMVRFFLKQDNNVELQHITRIQNILVRVRIILERNHTLLSLNERYNYQDIDMQLRLWLRKRLPQRGEVG
jgi:ankyrin repeat protein